MDNFCIITNNEKDRGFVFSKEIRDYIIAKGKHCVIPKESMIHIMEYDPYIDVNDIPEETECAIILGGDGTLIHAANDLFHRQIPLLGVNIGTLGFLTEVDKEHVYNALERLFADEYTLDKRMMLRSTIMDNSRVAYQGYALNDVVISKRGMSRIITVEVYVNDQMIDTYLCDGMIVSTATGSTGYNLSAGGPMVVPGLEAMIITAICPHSLHNRCVMVSATDELKLVLGKSKEGSHIDAASAIHDGRVIRSLCSGDVIHISKAEKSTNLLKVNDTNFFEIVRSKIMRGRC